MSTTGPEQLGSNRTEQEIRSEIHGDLLVAARDGRRDNLAAELRSANTQSDPTASLEFKESFLRSASDFLALYQQNGNSVVRTTDALRQQGKTDVEIAELTSRYVDPSSLTSIQ